MMMMLLLTVIWREMLMVVWRKTLTVENFVVDEAAMSKVKGEVKGEMKVGMVVYVNVSEGLLLPLKFLSYWLDAFSPWPSQKDPLD